jgi:hypothetical protein
VAVELVAGLARSLRVVLNKLTKVNKPNTTQYYVYDYQGKRVRLLPSVAFCLV